MQNPQCLLCLVSDSLQTKTRISILAQSFNPASVQPLPSLSTSNMVACTKAKTNCTRDLEKSVEASYIWLDSCVSQGGALTNGLPFYQRANWPREMSFLSQGQGYPAFVANFTIRRAGFSFWLFVSTGNHFATHFLYKMSFSEKNLSNPRQSVIDASENLLLRAND